MNCLKIITIAAILATVGCNKREGEDVFVRSLESKIVNSLPDYLQLKEFKREDLVSEDKRHVTITLTGVVAAKEPLYYIDDYDSDDILNRLVERHEYWSKNVPAIIYQKYAPGDTFLISKCNVLGNMVGKEWQWQLDMPLMQSDIAPLNLGRPLSECPKFHFIKGSPELAAYNQQKEDKETAHFNEKRKQLIQAINQVRQDLTGSGKIWLGKNPENYHVTITSMEGTGDSTRLTFKITEDRRVDPAVYIFSGAFSLGRNLFELKKLEGPDYQYLLTFTPHWDGNLVIGSFQQQGFLPDTKTSIPLQ